MGEFRMIQVYDDYINYIILSLYLDGKHLGTLENKGKASSNYHPDFILFDSFFVGWMSGFGDKVNITGDCICWKLYPQ